MNKNEFNELFKDISKKELLRFEDYLKSPFFNVPKRIVKLYELLQKINFGTRSEPITREMISGHFYPGKDYSVTQVNIRKLISEFKNHFYKFLAEREFEARKFEQNIFLLKNLRQFQKVNEYKKVLEETKILISDIETKDEDYYREFLELYKEQYLFEGSHYKTFSKDLSFQISEYLDFYFIAYKLFLYQRLEGREFVLKTNIHKEPKFYDAVCKEILVNKEYYKNHPEIYCRYLMLQMMKSQTGSKELYDEYLEYLNYADMELKINCYSYYDDLLNHCIKMVNYGRSDFEERIIDFTILMENKKMFEKYGLSANDMKIIMESMIGMKKYDRAEDFVKRNIEYVEDLNRENIYNLGLAKIFFFKKDYTKSRDHLLKVSFADYLNYIDAKLIEARIEYEERSFAEIFSVIETVRKYLKSHTEIGEIYRKTYLAFVTLLPRLVKIYEFALTQNLNDFEIEKLKDDIDAYPELLYGAEWLKNKLEEIEKGRL